MLKARWIIRQRIVDPTDVKPDGVVAWLNAKAGTEQAKRVQRIIELQAARRAMTRWSAATSEREKERLTALSRDMKVEKFHDVDLLMDNYWVSPRFVYAPNRTVVYYVPKQNRGAGRKGVTHEETAVVMCLVELATRDELDRVRRCNCGKWFYATALHQMFCSDNCRVKHHQSSPEFKAKRREYLRLRYKRKKAMRH